MKKFALILAAAVLALSMVACGNSSSAASSEAVSTSSSEAASSEATDASASGDVVSYDMMATYGSAFSSMGLNACTMDFTFTDEKVSKVELVMEFSSDIDDAIAQQLKDTYSSTGEVTVDGKTVTIDMNDISAYADMDKATLQTAMDAATSAAAAQ